MGAGSMASALGGASGTDTSSSSAASARAVDAEFSGASMATRNNIAKQLSVLFDDGSVNAFSDFDSGAFGDATEEATSGGSASEDPSLPESLESASVTPPGLGGS